MRSSWLAAPLLALALVPSALAGPLAPVATPPEPDPPEPIWGGAAVEACGWPTTVYLEYDLGFCTGTLVHPELVVFAAHCMVYMNEQSPTSVIFGEAANAPAWQLAPASCTRHPRWAPIAGYEGDIAFCVLGEPVTDVPIVPILMGCETDVLQPDQPVTLVGFGQTDADVLGVKHEVTTTINGVQGSVIDVGGNGAGSCGGDSGGPAYVQLPDGSWRVFGATAGGTSPSCADASIYGLLHAHVPWLEDESGLDLTPCHDADGTWNPGEGCTDFPLTPGVGEGDWASGCAPPRLSGPAATCGEPFGEAPGTTGSMDTGEDDTSGDDTSSASGPVGATEAGTTGQAAGSDTFGGSGTSGSSTAGELSAANDAPDTGSACSCRSRDPGHAALGWSVGLLMLAGMRRRGEPRRRLGR